MNWRLSGGKDPSHREVSRSGRSLLQRRSRNTIDMLMVFKYSLKVCPSLHAGLQNDSLSSCIYHCGLTRNVDSGVRAIFKLVKNPIASIRMSESPILLSEEREVESDR